MEKTKLGVSASLMAAVVCLLCYYGGYVVTALVVGYVLLVEESAYLKRFVLKVLALLLAFSLLSTVFNLLPSILSLIRSLIYIFDKYAYGEDVFGDWIYRTSDFWSSVISMAKMILFLLMGIMSFLGKELTIPGFDKLLDKYLEK